MDLIERQSAIDAANRSDYDGLTVEDVAKVTDAVVEELKQLPSAQPEDCDTCKHGRFGSEACDNCRVRYPSHYEKEESNG